jgi:hypothetical protein
MKSLPRFAGMVQCITFTAIYALVKLSFGLAARVTIILDTHGKNRSPPGAGVTNIKIRISTNSILLSKGYIQTVARANKRTKKKGSDLDEKY